MNRDISALVAHASQPIRDPAGRSEELTRLGALGAELGDLLRARNGFYAYQSALLVRPLTHSAAPLGALEWNMPGLWRKEYASDLRDAFFFAEDVFGGQYCVREGSVCSFDPETARFEVVGSSLSKWARTIVNDYQFRTGFPLAHEWQRKNGPLSPGMRLLPKVPFICGGKYEVENLYELADVMGMQFRASIANQIRDLPDGAEIIIKVTEHPRPE